MSALSAQGLTLWRGANCLFENLSFELSGGSFLLVRGANGSGKTTLLRVLSGLTRPEAGKVEWNGLLVDSASQPTGSWLAYCGHANGLKADLTVQQNLHFWAQLQGFDITQIPSLLASLDLEECISLEVRYLSAGQQRRTALARLLMADAAVWLLDEPLTNLDAAGRDFIEQRLQQHVANGGIAVAASHEVIELQGINAGELTLGVAA